MLMNLTKKQIYLIAVVLRVILFVISVIFDTYTTIGYTDIDYKVFSDGAKYVTKSESPFQRHTYRYTPLLAVLMTPNVYVSAHFGKIFFIACDMLSGFFIDKYNSNLPLNTQKAMLLIWFFNPLTFSLSTRGSADIIITVLVLLAVYLLERKAEKLSAVVYGFAVHFKIYPIIYCLAIYLHLKGDRPLINSRSVTYGLIAGITFSTITYFFYLLYGFEYLYEGYLYHLIRKDHRHNFSINFMYIYLNFHNVNKLMAFFFQLPNAILILLLSFKFNKDLVFAMFLLTHVFVIYNKVVTAQYFVWYIQFVPLILPKTTLWTKNRNLLLALSSVWLFLVIIWNHFAHQFEGLGNDSFMAFHWTNLAFFCVNVIIILMFIDAYHGGISKTKTKDN